MTLLLGSIGRACIFAVCAETLIQFRAREGYGKYLKLLVGLMILSQLIGPFCNLFTKKSILPLGDRVNIYLDQFEEEYGKIHFGIDLEIGAEGEEW